MPGIGVISNRNARLNKLHPELKDQLAYVMGSDGEVSSTGSITDAYKAAELFRRIGIDIIAISGGDGTAHRTMEILVEVYGDAPDIALAHRDAEHGSEVVWDRRHRACEFNASWSKISA